MSADDNTNMTESSHGTFLSKEPDGRSSSSEAPADNAIMTGIRRIIMPDDSIRDDKANGWTYFLMVFMALITVFSLIFGSYQAHQRQAEKQIITAVYDASEEYWYADPLTMDNTELRFKQFNKADIRVFVPSEKKSLTDKQTWKLAGKDYKLKSGSIANISCLNSKYDIATGAVKCKGSAVINVTGHSTRMLDMLKANYIQR